ncbi:uncharacterized protein METZ01_LOCUS23677 [marine metagenome]|uniref:Uncharacterized protein n=1 Tax=marine metagenome TaxID=408172 RepID=A0A381PZK0_9ZZZZ
MITDCLVKSQNTRHVCHSRKACPWPDMTEGIYFFSYSHVSGFSPLQT